MAITLGTTARNDSVAARTALANSGKLKIKNGGGTVLATFTLPATAFGTPSSGSATARGGDGTNPISSGNPLTVNASVTGTAASYDVTTGADAVLWSGSVGSDMTLNNTSITSGQEVKVEGWTHSQPA